MADRAEEVRVRILTAVRDVMGWREGTVRVVCCMGDALGVSHGVQLPHRVHLFFSIEV